MFNNWCTYFICLLEIFFYKSQPFYFIPILGIQNTTISVSTYSIRAKKKKLCKLIRFIVTLHRNLIRCNNTLMCNTQRWLKMWTIEKLRDWAQKQILDISNIYYRISHWNIKTPNMVYPLNAFMIKYSNCQMMSEVG